MYQGKANQFLYKNPYAKLIQRRVDEDLSQKKKLQLYYALRLDKFQCAKCCHFYCSKKKLTRHALSDCLREDFQQKKKYA
jgi:hypothetical protein